MEREQYGIMISYHVHMITYDLKCKPLHLAIPHFDSYIANY